MTPTVRQKTRLPVSVVRGIKHDPHTKLTMLDTLSRRKLRV